MSINISKAIKQKTDAQLRLLEQDSAPVVREAASGDMMIADPNEYMQSLLAGKNVIITTAGNIKTINAVMGLLAGSNISISAPDANGKVTITATTPQATNELFGGIKAKPKTTEMAEIAIDSATGKLYAPSGVMWPDFITQDANGLNIYDSPEKTNIIATIGRTVDLSSYTETSHIPDMTGMTSPSGIVTASTVWGTAGNEPFRAFDRDSATYWNTASGLKTGWIAYEWTTDKKINKYTMRSRLDSSDGCPKNWTFEGWNGTAWIVLDTRTDVTWVSGEKKIFTCENEISFKKYRINVSANNGRATLSIAEIEMIEVSIGAYLYGLFTERYLEKLSGTTLPVASVDLRGQILTVLGGAGVADITYICIKDASDAYIWKEI